MEQESTTELLARFFHKFPGMVLWQDALPFDELLPCYKKRAIEQKDTEDIEGVQKVHFLSLD